MKRLKRAIAVVLVCVTTWSVPARAQQYDYVVYDPENWWEAVLQLYQMYEQFRFLVGQARRLPVDMITRYRGRSVDWMLHDLSALFAQPILTALNTGDPTGATYRQFVDRLDVPTDVLNRMPQALQARLRRGYATIELADRVAERGVAQVGGTRAIGSAVAQTIRTMETDAAAPVDDFQTQTAVLNKINTATALGLRVADQTNQLLLDALEQLVVENARKRDAEARLMNATIYQWRYGLSYGQDLFRNTATRLDTWQLR
jgi:hypothetical protein